MKTLIVSCSSIAIVGFLALGGYVWSAGRRSLKNGLFLVILWSLAGLLAWSLGGLDLEASDPGIAGDGVRGIGLAGAMGFAGLAAAGFWRRTRATGRRSRRQTTVLLGLMIGNGLVSLIIGLWGSGLGFRHLQLLCSLAAVINLATLTWAVFGYGYLLPAKSDVGDSIFRSLEDMVALFGPDGRLVKANLRFYTSLTTTPNRVRDLNFEAIVTGSDRIGPRWKDLLLGKQQAFDCRLQYFHGGVRVVTDSHLERLYDRFGDFAGVLVVSKRPADIGQFQAKYGLTQRELEVVAMAVKGLANPAIAGSLTISKRTVEAHLFNIYNKIGINNKLELLSLASRYVRS